MAIYNILPRVVGFVLSEASGERSRGVEILAENQAVRSAQPLARTASGTLAAWDPIANDGPAICLPISAESTGAAATKTIEVIVRDAEIQGWAIAWPPEITDAQRTRGIAQLARQGLIVR